MCSYVESQMWYYHDLIYLFFSIRFYQVSSPLSAHAAELHIDLQGWGGQNFCQMYALRKDGLLWMTLMLRSQKSLETSVPTHPTDLTFFWIQKKVQIVMT